MTARATPSAGWLSAWHCGHVRPRPAHPTAITVGPDTRILVTTNRGMSAPLPALWLWNFQQQRGYCDGYSAQPLTISRLPDCELIEMSTNILDGHCVWVAPDTPLRTWDGGIVLAGAIKSGSQLQGERGMYVVTTRRRIAAPWAYHAKFTSVGGIYVGLDS